MRDTHAPGEWRASLPVHRLASDGVLSGAAALALLGCAMRLRRARAPLMVISGVLAWHAGTTLARPPQSTREALAGRGGRHLKGQVTIARTPAEVYALWRDPAQLADALPPRVRVESFAPNVTRWQLTSKDGSTTVAEWTAELINDEPDRLLAWRTTSDATVLSAGSVRFSPAPGGQGTEVGVHLQYAAPLGAVGAGLAKLTPFNPSVLLGRSLDHIKRYLEFGRHAVLVS
jgi:uncharacterized membrane protein